MHKIPTLFIRNPEDRRHVLPQVTPGCEWVLAGEGVATRKYDGTCVMLDTNGSWWARREVKPGKTPPEGWRPVDHDDVTGKSVGWEPIEQSPFYKCFSEIMEGFWIDVEELTPGTYELIGPKINGNPENAERHMLVEHDAAMQPDHLNDASVSNQVSPETLVGFVGCKYGWEGIVWHHPDGRMAKLKYRDLPPNSTDRGTP